MHTVYLFKHYMYFCALYLKSTSFLPPYPLPGTNFRLLEGDGDPLRMRALFPFPCSLVVWSIVSIMPSYFLYSDALTTGDLLTLERLPLWSIRFPETGQLTFSCVSQADSQSRTNHLLTGLSSSGPLSPPSSPRPRYQTTRGSPTPQRLRKLFRLVHPKASQHPLPVPSRGNHHRGSGLYFPSLPLICI